MGPPGGPPPNVPEGWRVNWSDQYSQWFYLNSTTGASQWEYPYGPVYPGPPAAPPQQVYYPPPQKQYAQPAATAKTGIMGKLSSLDPRTQAALAAGGGLAAGALLEHKIEEFSGRPPSPHHGGHHHVLGTMAGLMGAAGAGTFGAKLFGKMGHGVHAAPPSPTPSPYPASPPAVSAYPVQAAPPPAFSGQPMPSGAPSSGPGMGGLGNPALGGAAGMAGALAVGGASNLLHHHHDQGGVSAGVPTSVGGTGSIAPFRSGSMHSGPPLIIHAAAYADMDVTDKVRARVTPDQVFSVEKLSDEFGDPWPEVKVKMFSVLYQYGERPLEVWAGCTETGKVDIRNEALANLRMSYVNKDPGRIICLIWGKNSVLSKERIEKLETDGELDCSGLGDGGFYPWETRNLICYYKAPNGGVGVGHGREGGTMRLPWNPLAKWS